MSFWNVFMKNSTKLGMFLVAIFCAVGARAEPINFDVGYSKLHFRQSSGTGFNPDHVKFALSRNNYEAIASVNVKSDDLTLNGVVDEAQIPYVLGLFYKPEIQLRAGINLFARLGLTHASAEIKGSNLTGGKWTSSGNGIGYGFGMSMLSTSTSKITVDYTTYYNRQGTAIKSVSLTHSFLIPY